MAGSILERLSNRKLAVVIGIILSILLISFMVGAVFAPSPTSTDQALGVKCIPTNISEISIPRSPSGPINCHKISDTRESKTSIVFAFQLPLPRDGIDLDYSRWMSNLLAVMIPDLTYTSFMSSPADQKSGQEQAEHINGTVVLKVTLAVKNIGDEKWKVYQSKDRLKRKISCTLPAEHKHEGYKFECDMIPLFELQSLFYDYYLINIQLLDGEDGLNNQLNSYAYLSDIGIATIHQNGGFTKVWMCMKIFFFTLTLSILIWHWKRLSLLGRKKTLLESTIIALGIALTQLNAPIELISLLVDFPYNAFLSDIRQGLLHCTLFTFWTIFTGEHLMDGMSRGRISAYYKPLSIILTTSISLFVFDSILRGLQGFDPFFSLWDVDPHLAIALVVIAALSAVTYFFYLCYHVYLVMVGISSKRNSFTSMSLTRRLIYQGVVSRFMFFLVATLVCAAFSLISYVIRDPKSMNNDLDDQYFTFDLEWTSGICSFVYAMYNCYVMSVLILYAPSHKNSYQTSEMDIDLLSEQSEFSRLTDGDSGSISTTTASRSINPPQVFESEMQLLHNLSTRQAFD